MFILKVSYILLKAFIHLHRSVCIVVDDYKRVKFEISFNLHSYDGNCITQHLRHGFSVPATMTLHHSYIRLAGIGNGRNGACSTFLHQVSDGDDGAHRPQGKSNPCESSRRFEPAGIISYPSTTIYLIYNVGQAGRGREPENPPENVDD
jgi:hypothetical protein